MIRAVVADGDPAMRAGIEAILTQTTDVVVVAAAPARTACPRGDEAILRIRLAAFSLREIGIAEPGGRLDDECPDSRPRDERKRQCGGPVKPLCVVDDAQERTALSRVGEQAEDREADQELRGCQPSLKPNTTRSASRWGAGSRPSRSSNGAQS
jgi:hypothetical protein